MSLEQFSKKWEDLTFSDNFLFCKVLQNKDLCKEFIETLLSIKIDHVDYINSEISIENYYNSRGIRMDVFVKDSNRVFDLEMQTGNYTDLLLRARYYQSTIDTSTLHKGDKYDDLKESFIIFICKKDPFGFGLPCYTEEKSFKEIPSVIYNDKTHKIFYNASAFDKESNKKISKLLEYISEIRITNNFTQNLDSEVKNAKIKPQLEKEFMFMNDLLEEAREEAIKQGLAEGLAQGIEQGIEKEIKEIVLFMKNNGKSYEEIAGLLGKDVSLIKNIYENL